MRDQEKAEFEGFHHGQDLDTVEVDLLNSLKSLLLLGGGKSPVWRRKEGFQLLLNDHA